VSWIRSESRGIDGFELSPKERLEFVARVGVSPAFLALLGIGFLCFYVLPRLWSQFHHLITDPMIERIIDAQAGEIQDDMRTLILVVAGVPLTLMYGGGLIAIVIFSRRFTHRQRAIMRKMGFPICMECGYHLTGLQQDPKAERCPECGAAIAEMPELGERESGSSGS